MSVRNESGFGHIMLLVGVVVIAAVVFAAWRVMDARQPAASDVPTSTATALPGKIESADDLAKVSKSLDQGAAQLDNNLDGSQLDADINAML